MRIGYGFDAHRFEKNRRLVLGGVVIPYELGLAAHSDGDVVIHAVCDALLGAAALGDIGQHFPGTAEFKDIDSRILLRRVHAMLIANAYKISNVDVTIIAEQPKLMPFRDEMRKNLAEDLEMAVQEVSVKATTTDGMGFCGRKEGIMANAVAIIL